jgi:flagellin
VTVTNNPLMFQIGPNAAQTARIGLPELTTTVLGNNISGNQFASLYEIDVTTFDKATDALEIVDDVVNQISTLRGELGSFQANTLESNLAALRVTAENLIAAESVIRDTDFWVEVANFTKQQILRQAGGTVLTNAAQAPQLVLQLLR